MANKRAYLAKHGAELEKPEERGNQTRAEHALAEPNRDEDARSAEPADGERPQQPPGQQQQAKQHNAEQQRARRALQELLLESAQRELAACEADEACDVGERSFIEQAQRAGEAWRKFASSRALRDAGMHRTKRSAGDAAP